MTTDLLDLARRVKDRTQDLDVSVAATTSGTEHPTPDVWTDPPAEDRPGTRGGGLLAVARSFRTGDATDTDRAKSAIRGESPPASPLLAHLSLIAQPDAPGTARLSPAGLSERPEANDRRRCFTCGQAADGTWDDGSPHWHHGHDLLTGQRWTTQPRRGRVGHLRTCPACAAEHAVGTTCGPVAGSGIDESDRPGVGIDLLAAALAVFGDDVERVIAVIDQADRPGRSVDRCAISERSAQRPEHHRRPHGHRPRDKREKREERVLGPELIPLFDEGGDGSHPPGTPA